MKIYTDHIKLRQAVCMHMLNHYPLFINYFSDYAEFLEFVNKMKKPNSWAENEIIFSTSLYVNRNLFTISAENTIKCPLNRHYLIDDANSGNLEKCLILGYNSQNHFQSLILPTEMLNTGASQNENQLTTSHMTPLKRQLTLNDYLTPTKKRVTFFTLHKKMITN